MESELALRKRKTASTSHSTVKRRRISNISLTEEPPTSSEPDDSSQDGDGYDQATTPVTPTSTIASPRSLPPCRTKHLPCPYPGCDKSFSRPTRLEEHKRSHTNERIFKCEFPGCDKDFLRDTHLKRHVASAHVEKKEHLCNWEDCDKGFATAQRLKRHLALHEDREKYRCKVTGCGQVFRKHSTLDQHQRTAHQGVPAFSCQESNEDGATCEKGFDTAYALKLHKGRCHGAKSYWCNLCPDLTDLSSQDSKLAFGTYSELQAHNQVAHPPTCLTCGHQAPTQKALKHHVNQQHPDQDRASSKTPIFTCPYDTCNGQTFTRSTNLTTHIKSVHQNSKPFICGTYDLSTLNNIPSWPSADACGRAFKAKQGLEEHIRTAHLGLDNKTVAWQKLLGTYEPPSPNPTKKGRKGNQVSALSKLTGTSYAEDPRRTIPCSVTGCAFRFTRNYDLELHLQCKHGLNYPDIQALRNDVLGEGAGAGAVSFPAISSSTAAQNTDDQASADFTAALEASASAGGPFWIGGNDGHSGGFLDDEGLAEFGAFGAFPVDDPLWEGESREMFGLIDGEGGDGNLFDEEFGRGLGGEVRSEEGEMDEMEVDVPVDPRLC